MPKNQLVYITAAFPPALLARAKIGLEKVSNQPISNRNDLLVAALEFAASYSGVDDLNQESAEDYLKRNGFSFTRRKKARRFVVQQQVAERHIEYLSFKHSEPKISFNTETEQIADFAEPTPMEAAREYLLMGESDPAEIIRLILRDLPNAAASVEDWKPAVLKLIEESKEKKDA